MNPVNHPPAVPRANSGQPTQCDHVVHFYEHDDLLLDALAGFLSAGLHAGEGCLVIATAPHHHGLETRLQRNGVPLRTAVESGQYVSLDAAEMLAQFMLAEQPDRDRFITSIGGVLGPLCRRHRAVRAFGEMVALLCVDGHTSAALRLEELWNDLGERHGFSLFCGYPLTAFQAPAASDVFGDICAKHSRILAEAKDLAPLPGARAESIIAPLQHKAVALEAEIAERKRIEEQLARREKELADFLENSVVGLHQVGPDGTILWVNQAELDLLGYRRDEYIGRHITQFHVDQRAIDDILARLWRGEAIRDYPARLRCKDGTIKDVLIHSNGCFQDGQFLRTRCFTVDVTEHKRADEAVRGSAAQFRQLADALPQIVWTARPDGFIDYYNERWYEYTGFPRGEYGDQSWEPILHPEDLPRCKETYYRCIHSGEPYQIEYRFKDPRHGGYRWFLGRAYPVRDERGAIVRWFGTCTDIDLTKQAETALQHERVQLQATQRALQEKIVDLETFHDVAVSRELKMIELERELQSLRERLKALKDRPAPPR